MINKTYSKGFLLVILLCVALLGVGAVYDWQITDALYNPTNPICIFVESVSKLPIYFFIPVMGACLMVRNRNSIANFAVGSAMLMISWCLYAYSMETELARRGLLRRANPYISGIIGGILAAVTFLLIRGLKKAQVRKIQAVCRFGFVMFIGYLGGIGALKYLCGRDRYDDIITGGEYVFAKWYQPVFLSSGSSFPSGHTAACMGLLTLLLLPFIFEKLENYKAQIFIADYVLVLLTGLTRLVMGRHFLSDVAMAILCMTVGFIVTVPMFERLYNRELLEKYRKYYLIKSRQKRAKKRAAKKTS